MPDRTLIARVEEEEGSDQVFLVRSPGVGILDRAPARGSWVDPAQGSLVLAILGRRHVVRLPAKVRGWVTESLVEETFAPIEYDQPLFRVSPAGAPAADRGAVAGSEAGEGLEEGLVPVLAPSHGVFYRRPDPDSPFYVEEGGEVSAGTVLGLVEIMKCFHQIAYGGPDLPDRGTVARILVEDSAEVKSGQPLFLIRPAG